MTRFTATGTWEAAGDRDWFAVNLPAGLSFTYALGGSYSGLGSLALRQSGGVTYLAAESSSGVGAYAIELTSTADDLPGSSATAASLAPGDSLSGSWEVAGDADWLQVTLAANQSVTATLTESLTGTASIGFVQADGGLLSATGVRFGPGSATIAFTAATAGTYTLAANSLSTVGTYSVALATYADDAPDNAATTLSVAVDGPAAAGTWEVGTEDDWFAVVLTAGLTYRLSLAGSGTIGLRGAAGALVGASNAGATDVTVPTSGTWYVAAHSLGGTGTYTVQVATIADDHAGSAATGGTLLVGASTSGLWGGSGDADWFAVSLAANQSYTATLTEAVSGDGSIAFRNADGSIAGAAVQTSLGSATAVFTAPTAGIWYLVAESRNATGAYGLALAGLADDHPDNAATTGTLAVGGGTTGSWNAAGDADWFAVGLVAGLSYRLTLTESLGGGGTARLRSADGAELSAASGTAGTTVFTPLATGTYYAAAASTDAVGGYALALSLLADDHGNTPASAGTALAEGGAGADSLEGTAGGDSMAGLGAADTLRGLGGNDTLDGGAGTDQLVGGPGDDLYLVDSPGDEVFEDSGGGRDTVLAATDHSLYDNIEVLVLAAGAGDLLGMGNGSANSILGNAGANRLFGGEGADTLSGGDGDDQLYGEAGSDSLEGGTGADILLSGEGDDSAAGGEAADALYGEAGNDSLSGEAGADTLFAGEGRDSLAGGDGADMLFGEAGDDSQAGGAGGDHLHGGLGADTLDGGEATDILYGEAADDSLSGGAGADYLFAGEGRDSLDGGAGADVLYGEAGDDSLSGGSDAAGDQLTGGEGNDTLNGAGGLGEADTLRGEAGDDTYLVDSAADLLTEAADGGTDLILAAIAGGGWYLPAWVENLRLLGTTLFGVGNALANGIEGDAAANYLLGGAGDDTLTGGAGNDSLFGEAGADRFDLARGLGQDVIGDFVSGTDRIRLAGFQPGGTPLDGFAGVLARFQVVGGHGVIDLGTGDGLRLTGVTSLVERDFIFA